MAQLVLQNGENLFVVVFVMVKQLCVQLNEARVDRCVRVQVIRFAFDQPDSLGSIFVTIFLSQIDDFLVKHPPRVFIPKFSSFFKVWADEERNSKDPYSIDDQ